MERLERKLSNHALLNCLIVEYGTMVLRTIFDQRCPPQNLQNYLSHPQINQTLFHLRARAILNMKQWKLLYPESPLIVSSAKFDITLLVILLRNICGFKPPGNYEWNEDHVRSNSVEVNITRLKDYKNTFVSHPSSASLDDATFEENWAKISSTIIELGGQRYALLINQLKSVRVDVEAENRSQVLLKIQQKLKNLEGMLIMDSFSLYFKDSLRCATVLSTN